jgi:hypothetical protein
VGNRTTDRAAASVDHRVIVLEQHLGTSYLLDSFC